MREDRDTTCGLGRSPPANQSIKISIRSIAWFERLAFLSVPGEEMALCRENGENSLPFLLPGEETGLPFLAWR